VTGFEAIKVLAMIENSKLEVNPPDTSCRLSCKYYASRPVNVAADVRFEALPKPLSREENV